MQDFQISHYVEPFPSGKGLGLYGRPQISPLMKEIYPHFLFREVSFDQLSKVDTSKIIKPFIIKPAIGFFSMGVYKVSEDNEWKSVIGLIQDEMEKVKGLYPIEVMNSSKFIIEEYIEGAEY
ncbi:ATP-grasp domain-containing protein [Desulfosporosinus sp. BICA1-9]|uniref:ATP-grasp domain-containing protein n=1 Tax=Desulfosporosinus sp. BICA1-9 TaxID=1531958 RepID=UPI00054B41CB|nr:ATP-grasp domain-containing protein [Desulfosporosinus sp. BICA1-9]KJS47879.1 MAG: hypothetical protein VR66_17165 [Peptococcaceae bacterium BRH_c23]KJS80017.1 MAG: hypothetical protein JL57_28905 [Desulfosporosinus sp. BICA1-9]HBW36073.1 ATP-grasp domain-containing protein [Desulfosporosinus sp.]